MAGAPQGPCVTCGSTAEVLAAIASGLELRWCLPCWHGRIHRVLAEALDAVADTRDVYGPHPALAGAERHYRAQYVAFCLEHGQAPRPLEAA